MTSGRWTRCVGAGALALVVSACASTGAERSESHSKLYDGRSELAFSTEFPVESPEEAELRAEKALREGDLDRALFEFVRALDFDAERPETLFRVGRIHVQRGNTDLAELAFRMTLGVEPKHIGAREELGLMALRSRNYELAAKLLTEVINDSHRRWRAYNGLGVIADLNGRHAVARLQYEAALRIRPNHSPILNNLGYSHYLSGDYPAAVATFKRVLGSDRDNELAWRNLGLVYARQDHYEQARRTFEKVMDRPSAYNNVGYIAMKQGDFELARTYFGKAADLKPSYYATAFENLERVQRLSAELMPAGR